MTSPGTADAPRASLGLEGDDDIDLVRDVEAAFAVRLPGDGLARCTTVGDLFALVAARLPRADDTAQRCATAICFHRLRRIVLALRPGIIPRGTTLRPATPLAGLRGLPVRRLHRAMEHAGLRPPPTYLSAWAGLSLLAAAAAAAAPFLLGIPWWPAALAEAAALLCCRFSPIRLPPKLRTFGDLATLVAARSIGKLSADGARLRDAEAWHALQTICADHAAPAPGGIGPATLLLRPGAAR